MSGPHRDIQFLPAPMIAVVTGFFTSACELASAPDRASRPATRRVSPAAVMPPGTPGGHRLDGSVQLFETTTPGPAGLCVQLVNPEPLAFDEEAETLATTTTDGAGTFSFSDLPIPPSMGWVLVVDACGDTTTYVPTGTILPGELVGGRGAADSVDAVAWLVPTTVRDTLDAGLEAYGSTSFLGEDGGMIGHSLGADGTPHQDSWVRGPNTLQLWYPHESGTYELYDGTESAEGALFIVPDAEYFFGVYVARVAGEQFQPLMAGGMPGVIQVWDFVSWQPRSSSPP